MKAIFLATGLIQESDLFKNGLHQNSLTLYTLFETIGFQSYCLVEASGSFVPGYRFLEPETYLQNPAMWPPVAWYIEIGLSFDTGWRAFLRRRGCRTAKLYLGNILNIDTETICRTPGLHFPHHKTGEFDEIWTSPHYEGHLSYALALHRGPRGRIAPYVWDPTWIQGYPRWTRPADWRTMDIVVVEPNLSFQKCSLYPILLVQAFRSAYPEWKGSLIVQNSERLFLSRWFRERLAPSLKGSIVWKGRQTLETILLENRSAAFVSYPITNDYNYLVLELLYLGFPILHHSDMWSTGSNWSINKWSEALQQLRTLLEFHTPRNHSVIWYHSSQNPINRSRWMSILA
jgi:hypothetical protein